MTQTPEMLTDSEERARGDVYALLSRLFAAPADARLLQSIAISGEADDSAASEAADDPSDMVAAWNALVAGSAQAEEAAVADEYNELFVGAGRAEISLYLGAYTARSSVDTPLVALRGFLASRGLQRRSGVHEPEDHVAMLLEIMRFMICEEEAAVEEQQQFFDRFVWSGAIALCDAISTHARAQFYRPVAAFAKQFLLVEHEAFGM